MRKIALLMTLVLTLVVMAGCDGQDNPAEMQTHSQEEYVYSYQVKPGQQTLSDVSEEVYGRQDMGGEIARANPSLEGNEVEPGMELNIPVLVDEEGRPLEPMGCTRMDVFN